MAAITPENFMQKLCFGLLGSADEASTKRLREKMTTMSAKLRKHGQTTVTRETIRKLHNGSIPTRGVTYSFFSSLLKDFINSDPYKQIPENRKAVLGQLLTFSNRVIRASTEQEIYGSSGGHVIIRQERIYPPAQYAEECEFFLGTYLAFKYRLTNDKENSISREVIEIYKNGMHLFMKWWVLFDGRKAIAFDGVVVFAGPSLWAILHNTSLGGRIRVFTAKKTGWGRNKENIHTGILLTTTPDPYSPTPAACRVFLQKINALNEDEIRGNLKHLKPHDLSDDNRDQILRIIKNDFIQNQRLESLDRLLKDTAV